MNNVGSIDVDIVAVIVRRWEHELIVYKIGEEENRFVNIVNYDPDGPPKCDNPPVMKDRDCGMIVDIPVISCG